MSNNDLIDFRTAYLRLIARTWLSDEYAQEVVSMTAQKLIVHLEKEYGHVWAWPALDPVLKDQGAVWSPQETGGWHGEGFSGQIKLMLPLDSSCIKGPPKNRTKALADFYELRPSIFGKNRKAKHPEGADGADDKKLDQAYPLGLGDLRDFLEFGGVLLRAIALVWGNSVGEEFVAKLQDRTSCLPALAGWLGYTSPWNMNIVIENDPNAAWNGLLTDETPEAIDDNKHIWRNGWLDRKTGAETIQHNQMILYLPRCPKDPQVLPVALASYNQTGPAYPFTCCP